MKMLSTVALSLCIYLALVLGWYATLPHRSGLADAVPYLGFFFAGFALGWLESRRAVSAATMLSLLLPLLSGLVHWGACHFDTRIDMCGFQASMTLQLFLLPASIGLCVLGAWLGAKLRGRKGAIT
jgi:hypothetical protein